MAGAPARPDLPLAGPDRSRRVRQMFDRIVPRYDTMNRLMTGAQDIRWRRRAARDAAPAGARALDLATGTADLAIELRAQGARWVVGADFSEAMLRAADAKLRRKRESAIALVLADAQSVPFPDASFDCITSAFLLRNVADLPRCLSEMRRVVRPNGRVVALEITHPRPGPFATLFGLYFKHAVPRLGRLVSGDNSAYTYLPASLDPFPNADRLSTMFREAGFARVRYRRVGFGTVAIHTAWPTA
jgi:demethylmenaquinone methyltransferase / 2-methoxy-6-polyprenyl-1,4-benzoquinol methylase